MTDYHHVTRCHALPDSGPASALGNKPLLKCVVKALPSDDPVLSTLTEAETELYAAND